MVIDVKELGASLPSAPIDAVAILPIDFAMDSESGRYAASAISFEKFARGHVPLRYLSTPQSVLELRSVEWIAPAMLVGAQLLAESPNTVSVLLNLLSAHLYDLFKGKEPPPIDVTLVCEKTASASRVKIRYRGDAAGLSALPEAIKAAVESGGT